MPSPRPRPVSLRHERGRSYLALVVNAWLRRSDLSLLEMSRIAGWGLGEDGCLSKSQLSQLKNRNIVRGASAKNLDGLAGANQAIWLWQERGEEEAIRRLGPPSSWQVTPEQLERSIWLHDPEFPDEALAYGDFAEIDAGYLQLPYLGAAVLSPSEATSLSLALAKLLNGLAAGGTPMDGINKVLDAYVSDDPERRERLRDLMLGGLWTHEELEAELGALALMVARLRGVPASEFGPYELHAELSAGRRRS